MSLMNFLGYLCLSIAGWSIVDKIWPMIRFWYLWRKVKESARGDLTLNLTLKVPGDLILPTGVKVRLHGKTFVTSREVLFPAGYSVKHEIPLKEFNSTDSTESKEEDK